RPERPGPAAGARGRRDGERAPGPPAHAARAAASRDRAALRPSRRRGAHGRRGRRRARARPRAGAPDRAERPAEAERGGGILAAAQLAAAHAGALAPADQDYLFQARQMQALSFAAHVPLVCFGIAFPAIVVFVEWLHRRTGDALYRTLAQRWSKVM